MSFSDDAPWGPLRNLQAQWPLSLASRKAEIDVESESWRPLIEINGRPWFLRKSNGPTSSFLWASKKYRISQHRLVWRKKIERSVCCGCFLLSRFCATPFPTRFGALRHTSPT